LNKRRDPRCPYVHNEKSSVYCADYLLHPEVCQTCGWNPAEHERRVKLLRAGVVKSFLNIDVDHLGTVFANGYKTQEDDDVYEDEGD